MNLTIAFSFDRRYAAIGNLACKISSLFSVCYRNKVVAGFSLTQRLGVLNRMEYSRSNYLMFSDGDSHEYYDHTLNMNVTGTWLEHNIEVNNVMVRFLDDYWYRSVNSAVFYVIAIFAGKRAMHFPIDLI